MEFTTRRVQRGTQRSRQIARWVPRLILVLSLGTGAMLLRRGAPTPAVARTPPTPHPGPLVEVRTVFNSRHEVAVSAYGYVVPAKQVSVQAEVEGRVVWRNPRLSPGGFVQKGDVLVRIDPRSYALAVDTEKASLSRAQLEIALEHGRKRVAEREWNLFRGLARGLGGAADADAEPLARRDPQLHAAQVAAESVRSALERAQLQLERTTLRAPFDAWILEAEAEVGQLLTPQARVATLVGTETYWVQVAVPLNALARLQAPVGEGEEGAGPRVRVWFEVGDHRVARDGRMVRILPDLDEDGAMARVLVALDDPLARTSSVVAAEKSSVPGNGSKGHLPRRARLEQAIPILLNAYVNVEITVPALERAFPLPRSALRARDRVYVVDALDKLHIKKVRETWRGPDSVVLVGGLEDGERVVIGRVAAPVEGMAVRPQTPEASAAAERSPRHATPEGAP